MTTQSTTVIILRIFCVLIAVREAASIRLCGPDLSRAVYQICSHGKRGYIPPTFNSEDDQLNQEFGTDLEEYLAETIKEYLKPNSLYDDVERELYPSLPRGFRRVTRTGGIARRCCSTGCSSSDIAKLC